MESSKDNATESLTSASSTKVLETSNIHDIHVEMAEGQQINDQDSNENEITISDKIAGVLADGWKSRVAEARQLVLDEVEDISEDMISTDAKFTKALEDGALLCKLAQSLSNKRGLNIRIKLSKQTPNGKARMRQQNFSRFSRFCRAINIQKDNVPSIQDLSSGRLKPIINCLCDIKRLRDDNDFQVYAATWEAFSTPTKGVGSPAVTTDGGEKAAQKPPANSILRVLRQSSIYASSMVPGFLGSPASSLFTGKLASQRHPTQPNHGTVNMSTLASLTKVEEKAKLTQDNRILEDKLSAAMEEIDQLKCLLQNKDQEMAIIKEECKSVVSGLHTKSEELHEATKTVNASVTVLESKDDELSTLRTKYAELMQKYESVSETSVNNTELQELRCALKSSETTVDNLVVELSETKMRESSLSGQVNTLSEKLESAEKDIKTSKARLEDQTFEHDKFKIAFTAKTAKVRASILAVKTKCTNVSKAYKTLAGSVGEELSSLRVEMNAMAKVFVQRCKTADLEKKELVENYEREIDSRRKVFNELQRLRGNIRVLCRVRPIDANAEVNTIHFTANDNTKLGIKSNSKGARQKYFDYDRVFQPHESQSSVYKEVSPMVQSSMDGFHSCIFAYGQTGSGKTYTMQGPANDPGVYKRSLEELFRIKEQRKETHDYTLSVSMVEIYNETIRDLLVPKGKAEELNLLEIRKTKDGRNHLPNANTIKVECEDDIAKTITLGEHNRSVGATKANEHSSRSHCLLMISIVGEEIESGAKMNGKLVLVDLAGSERVGKTAASGDRLREAKNINKSLSALGNVINALSNKQNHIPFRDSKLTYLLQNSLSKDNKVLMIAQVSPALANFQESVCSLEFAARAHGVELGKAKANVENMEVPKLQEQLKKVKDQLHEKDSKLRDFVSLKRKFKMIEEENNSLKSKISSMVDTNASSKSEIKEITNAMSKVSEKTSRMEKDLRDREDKLQQQMLKVENYQSKLCKAEQRVEQLENELRMKEREMREQQTIAGSVRSSARKARKTTSSRKRKSASPLAIRPLNTADNGKMSAKKGSVKPDGILKSTSSNGTKRTKRVNFNNENDVLEISRTDEEDTSVMESTPKRQRSSLRLQSKRSISASKTAKGSKTNRAKQLEEWKRKKASGTRTKRVGLLGGATRIKQTTSGRSVSSKTRTLRGSRLTNTSSRSSRASTRWN